MKKKKHEKFLRTFTADKQNVKYILSRPVNFKKLY